MAPSVEKRVYSVANVLEICVISKLLRRRRNRDEKRRVWVKTRVGKRDGQMCYNNLVKELAAEDAVGFRDFARLLCLTPLSILSPRSLSNKIQTTVALSPGRQTRSDPDIFGKRYVRSIYEHFV